MSDKTITVPADAQSVTLNIERKETHHAPTLRDMIEATTPTIGVRVLVKDTNFRWEFRLPREDKTAAPFSPHEIAEMMDRRRRKLSADLCDFDALLDERRVKIVKDGLNDDWVSFEVGVHV